MGIFTSSKEKAEEKAYKAFESFLLPGEEIQEMKRVSSSADSFVVTNKRLIIQDNEFDWGDSKAATFSVALSKISSLSLTSDTAKAIKKHRVGVHVGALTVKLTFYKEEECREAYMLIASLIY